MSDTVRAAGVALATLGMIVMNGLANALPLNGVTTGEISDRIEVWFTPAGYVFSIWALIYLGMLAFSVYQALPAGRSDPAVGRIAGPYVVSCAANASWIVAWHYGWFSASLLIMGVLLTSLITVYLRLGVGRTAVSGGTRWLVHAPFSVYLGWITVATIANTTSVLWLAGWGGFGIASEVWTAVVLGVATAIGAAMAVTRTDALYLLVLVWAFVGIYAKHADVSIVGTSAAGAAGVVSLLAVGAFVARVRRWPMSMDPT